MTTLRSSNGWLAPGGTFYPCSIAEHEKIISELINSTEDEAFDIGWLRLMNNEWGTPNAHRPVTFVQYGVLKDWHSVHGFMLPDWVHKA